MAHALDVVNELELTTVSEVARRIKQNENMTSIILTMLHGEGMVVRLSPNRVRAVRESDPDY